MIYDYFAAVDNDGIVRSQVRRAVPHTGNDFPTGGMTYYPIDTPIDWSAQPSTTSLLVWNDGSMEWVEIATLAEAQANAWAAAKKARGEAESADFEFAGTLYQPDVAKITGAFLAALLPRAESDPFAIDWTVADNSVVTLTAPQVMALGLTLTARINSIHQQGRQLRALIDNAATPAEAYGYTWNSLDA